MLNPYKKFSVLLFGSLVESQLASFNSLGPHLKGAGIKILLKTWVSMLFLTSILAYLFSFITVLLISIIFQFEFVIILYYLIIAPTLVASFTFLLLYLYPIERSNSIKNSIERDLPFALSHMSAIASSGIPPEFLFELLTGFKEYGVISKQAEMILRNMKIFGMSSARAIRDVASKTPSPDFKKILYGITSTMEKGGNLATYLKTMADSALFDYRIKREKYLKTLSTYADIYTALLVAAPLILLSVLGILSILGANILGLTVGNFIALITFVVLPAMNIVFLLFVHITYPGV